MPRSRPSVERRLIEAVGDPLNTITELISKEGVLEVHVAGMPEGLTIYRDGARICIAKKDSINCASGLDDARKTIEESVDFKVYKIIVYEKKIG